MEYLEKENGIPRKLSGSVKRRSSNLALTLILLPQDRRRDTFLFHDFCRMVDDIADSRISCNAEKQALLDGWCSALQPGSEADLPSDFCEMITRRRLDRSLLLEIIGGMRMDTEHDRYATFDDLRLYCWRVASAVGLVSAELFGAHGEPVTSYSTELGIALQLTNILRDVAEDATMGRIYFPQEDLERFCIAEEEILVHSTSPAMTHLLNFQAERADSHFAKAELAWSRMAVNQRRLMRPARLMSAIYRHLLLQMHRDRYDVFARKYRVPARSKLLLMLRVMTAKN